MNCAVTELKVPLPAGGFKIAAPAQLGVYQMLASVDRATRFVVPASDLSVRTGVEEVSLGPERGDGRAETREVRRRMLMKNLMFSKWAN